jgi:hypothetical protein
MSGREKEDGEEKRSLKKMKDLEDRGGEMGGEQHNAVVGYLLFYTH